VSMWDPFTEPARRSIVRAQEIASRHSGRYIDHDDIFLAAAEDEGVSEALRASGVSLPDVLSFAERRTEPVQTAQEQEMVFTAEAKRLIELAFGEARKLGHDYVGPEHLVLGYLGTPANDCKASAALKIDADALRARLVDRFAEGSPAGSVKRPATRAPQVRVSLRDFFDDLCAQTNTIDPESLWNDVQMAADRRDLGAVMVYGLALFARDEARPDDVLAVLQTRLNELTR
jgi:ATP-dependent Clp protease ATP-binding subunit ClpA